MRGTDASLYIPQIAALAWGDFVNVDCAACHHIALLTPEPLLRVGLSPAARCSISRGGAAPIDWTSLSDAKIEAFALATQRRISPHLLGRKLL